MGSTEQITGGPAVSGGVLLPCVRESVARARLEVRGWLGSTHPVVDDAVLAASELVTNAVVHSAAKPDDLLELTVTAVRDLIYIAVTDPGSVADEPCVRPDQDGEHGRGLLIVQHVSLGWGVRDHSRTGRRTVWCALSFPAPLSGP
ncbi:hypothetical protein Sru01_69330 [Sphaerisporangium rufum]|uniref:Histidine kinase/HSP90-like ATPase domain-containing protein n=1 Tax=Sphaerisporangium rufum TaxID=1381558 RepID=A0A919R966_9ACTN|nr:ATP-binding protein [Sphaerisporangium rufum]GII81951.1 hypothetical protein Sru01_69330 [Sphaerisporangium rufum]